MTKFGEAFKAARKSGKKVFTFNGKKYNTKTKDDEKKSVKVKNPGMPAKRPSNSPKSGASRSASGKAKAKGTGAGPKTRAVRTSEKRTLQKKYMPYRRASK